MLNKDQLETAVNLSIESLYSNDEPLITEDVNERSLSHRLAIYIQMEIDKLENGWNVDCEYNRIGTREIDGKYIIKRMELPPRADVALDDVSARTVFPDINVHHRGEEGSDNNLLVIEMKKNSDNDAYDFKKLEQYGIELGYQWGVYINITPEGAACTWWKDGELLDA